MDVMVLGVFATSGKAQLAYECVGARVGVDVLLIHAGVTDRRSWNPVLDCLRDRHRCIAYDARGYGETTYEPDEGFSPVADALAVLDSAESGRVLVVGASIGGRVAIDLALAHPGRVAGLVLIGSGVSGAPSEQPNAATARLIEDIQSAETAGDLDEVNRLEAWLWLDGPTASEGRVGSAARELFMDMNSRALRATDPGTTAERPPAWPRLHEITAPALIIVGDLDLTGLQTIGHTLADRIPDARLLQPPGVAHLPHLEADRATLDQIAKFAGQLPHSPAAQQHPPG
jgi:pimeloyl-ACP methyl ester carboxylesterase